MMWKTTAIWLTGFGYVLWAWREMRRLPPGIRRYLAFLTILMVVMSVFG